MGWIDWYVGKHSRSGLGRPDLEPHHPIQEVERMAIVIMCLSLLTVLLAAAWSREHRLRRALQVLIQRLFSPSSRSDGHEVH